MFNLLNFFYVTKYNDHNDTYFYYDGDNKKYKGHHHTKKKEDKHDFEKCLYDNNYELDKCKHYVIDEKNSERTNENYQKCMKEAGDKKLDKKYCEERYQNLDKNKLFAVDDAISCFEGKFNFNDNCVTRTFTKNFSFLTKCIIKNLNEEALGIDIKNMSDDEKKKTRNKLVEAEKCSKVLNITGNTCKGNDLFHKALYICEKDRINGKGILSGLFDFTKGIFSLIYILFIIITSAVLFLLFITIMWALINLIFKFFPRPPDKGSGVEPQAFHEYSPIVFVMKIRHLNTILTRIWPMLFILVLVFYILWKFVGWLGFIWDMIGIFPPESKVIFQLFDGLFFGCFKPSIQQTLFCNSRNTWGLIEGLLEEQMKKTTELSEKEIRDRINSWRDIGIENEFFTDYSESQYVFEPQTKIIEHFNILDRLNTEDIFKNIDKFNEMKDTLTNNAFVMKNNVEKDFNSAKEENQQRMESSDSE